MVNTFKLLMFKGKFVLFDEWEKFFDGSKKMRFRIFFRDRKIWTKRYKAKIQSTSPPARATAPGGMKKHIVVKILYIWLTVRPFMSPPFLQKLTSIIEANLASSSFGVVDLAHIMGMSHSNLLRKVRSLTGKSVSQLIRDIRLNHAHELLLRDDLSVSEVAFQSGFSSPSYFCTCYHEFFGYPPGETKRQPAVDVTHVKERPARGSDGLSPSPVGSGVRKSKLTSLRLKFALFGSAFLVLVLAGLLFIPRSGTSTEPLDFSIGVMPLEMMTDDPEKQIYAHGLMDAILQNLARISDLRVVKVNSSEPIQKYGKNMRAIGKELNVAYILNCSFQKLEDSLRLGILLFTAAENHIVWDTMIYDCWKKLFSVQNLIAKGVAKEIRVKMSSMEAAVINNPITTDTLAYFYYLRAIEYQKSDFWDHHNKYAIRLFDTATKIDPNFALAWSGLSSCYRELYWHGWDRNPESVNKAKQYLDKALAISPNLKEIALEEAIFYYHCYRDYPKSISLLKKLNSEYPNESKIHYWIGTVYRRLGEYKKAVREFDQAISINPSDWSYWTAKAQTARAMRDYSNAESAMNKSISLNPSIWGSYEWLFMMFFKTGQLARATTFLEKNQELFPSAINKLFHAWLEIVGGNYEKAILSLQACPSDPFVGATIYFTKNLELGLTYRLINDSARAIDHFKQELDFLLGKFNENGNDERLYCSLGICYAGLGMKEQAMDAGKKALEILNIEMDSYGAYYIELLVVHILVMVGEFDDALEKLDLIMSRNGDDTAEGLKLNPFWEPVRNHPRFISIVNNPDYQLN
jgi:tetratricopeptide (TPR) repeat protein/AraC-like DNA-binding protein